MVYQTDIKELKLFKRGKVRDVYELDGRLLIVATDRISCFDAVLPTPIPDKGKILTSISVFWFSFLKDIVSNHFISSSLSDFSNILHDKKDALNGRCMIVKKCRIIPFECIVRGYLSGSGWREYKKKGEVCGIKLSEGLKESSELREPIFTPSTKVSSGHDENVDFEYMKNKVGKKLSEKIKEISISLYNEASDYAEGKGIIIADTKFEFGIDNGNLILVDEVLTPDSSRFWLKDNYSPGGPQLSFDKQFVRDYLIESGWDKTGIPPKLPSAIVDKTVEKYRQAFKLLAG